MLERVGNRKRPYPAVWEQPLSESTFQWAIDANISFGHPSHAQCPVLGPAKHEIWRKIARIGKLHNLCRWIHPSDQLRYRLNALQEEFL
jgi:hypothetical protein